VAFPNPLTRHVPTAEDPTVEGASQLIGGRWGRHAGGRLGWWWAPLEVAFVVIMLVLIGGYLQKAQCMVRPLSTDHGHTTSSPYTNEYQYTHLCYTDTYVLYGAEQLNAKYDAKGNPVGDVGVPYRDHPVEYPPVIGGLMWTAAELTSHLRGHGHADVGAAHATTFFNITALGLALCALITAFALARIVGRRREWDVLIFAASPVLFMDAFINWDLVAVACTVVGLWFWSRRWPMWAGVMLGLGIATKLVPAFVLLGLVMLCLRERKWEAIGKVVGGAVAAVVVMYLPAIELSHQTSKAVFDAKDSVFRFPSPDCAGSKPLTGWRWFSSLSQQRGTDWGSLWLLVQHLASGLQSHVSSPLNTWLGKTNTALSGPTGPNSCSANPNTLNWISGGSVGLVAAGVGALIAGARRRPRVGQVAFLLVAGFVMLNKVDSPQYALWLLPLAVLARPRWASLLIWQVSEVVLGAANLYTLIALDHSDQGLPLSTYLVFIAIRDVILVWLMVLVVREVIDPRLDIVRTDGVDDPAGGVLAVARA
jgi:uncharacterized membrane protein